MRRSSTPASSAPRTASSRSSVTSTRRRRPSLVRSLLDGWAAAKPYRADRASVPRRARRKREARSARQGERGPPGRNEPRAERFRSRLSGPRPRQLHARRRLPQLAARGPHPPEGRPELRRRLAVLRRARSTPRAASTSSRFTRLRTRSKLEKALREEIARALEGGFTEQEVTEAKSGWLQSRQVQRANDQGLAGTLAGELYLGRTLQWDADCREQGGRAQDRPDPGRPAPTPRSHEADRRPRGDFAKAPAAP